MAAGTFRVRGRRLRTGSNRRYVLFGMHRMGGEFVVRRSDKLETVLAAKRRYNGGEATEYVVVDTSTGEEVG